MEILKLTIRYEYVLLCKGNIIYMFTIIQCKYLQALSSQNTATFTFDNVLPGKYKGKCSGTDYQTFHMKINFTNTHNGQRYLKIAIFKDIYLLLCFHSYHRWKYR